MKSSKIKLIEIYFFFYFIKPALGYQNEKDKFEYTGQKQFFLIFLMNYSKNLNDHVVENFKSYIYIYLRM